MLRVLAKRRAGLLRRGALDRPGLHLDVYSGNLSRLTSKDVYKRRDNLSKFGRDRGIIGMKDELP